MRLYVLALLALVSLPRCLGFSSVLEKPATQTKPGTTKESPPPSPQDPQRQQRRNRERTFLHKLDQFLTNQFQDPTDHLKTHTYLTGNYAPVAEEHTMAPVAVVEGKLPRSLDGMFCRNGPNPIVHDDDDGAAFRKRHHWFDGPGMLHNLRIQEGEAWYTNQYVPSIHYQVEQDLGEDFFPRLGEYQGLAGFVKILFHPQMVQEKVSNLLTVAPPNTNVLMYNNKFYCLHEANLPFECRLRADGTLEPIGYETFEGALDYPISAHPRICPQTNDLLFHSYTVNTDLIEENGIMKVGRYDASKGKMAFYFVPIDSKDYVSFAHGMVHSEHYTIVWDCSVHFEPKALFDGGSYFRSKADYPLRFGLIPRNAQNANDVIWINTHQAGAIVHPLNAWEEDDGTIVVWTPLCKELDLDLETEEINEFNMAEFRLDPKARQSTCTIIDNSVNVEFSVVPEMGRFTRHGYTAIQDKNTPGEGSFSGFCIWDFVERKPLAVYYDENEVGGEPMLSRDTVTGETYIGTYLNLKEEQSYFVLYDGTSGDLLCRLKMPHRVPFGFHGQWISGRELNNHLACHNEVEALVLERN